MAPDSFARHGGHPPGWAAGAGPGAQPGMHVGPHLSPHFGAIVAAHPSATIAAAYAIALALTLVLAAWLTPRHWWRRPTLGGGALLAGGALAFGTLFLALAGQPQPALAAADLPDAAAPPAPAPVPGAPDGGVSYRVAADLNLRADRGVHAVRLALLPAGSRVIASGAADGDWWQVRARVHGRVLTGWTSSLWLRRGDETP